MKSVYRAIESGDMSGLDAFCSKDFVDHETPYGEVKGLDSFKMMLSGIHNRYDIKFDMLSVAQDGGFVVALVKVDAKRKDGKKGPGGNTSITDTSVDVVKVVNGMATEHWSYEKPRMDVKKK